MKTISLLLLGIFASVSFATERELLSKKDFAEHQEFKLALQKRIIELEIRLNQDDCPCDLSKLGKPYHRNRQNVRRLFWFLEKDIKDNAEDITKNTVQITSLRGDVDEAVEIANSVSARVDGLAEQATVVAESVTGL